MLVHPGAQGAGEGGAGGLGTESDHLGSESGPDPELSASILHLGPCVTRLVGFLWSD